MNSLDAKAQLEEILNKDSVEIIVRNGKTLISTIDLFAVLSIEGWFIDDRGYVKRATSETWGNNIYLHNMIVGGKGVDHINGNKLDNRRENLRLVSHQQNMANTKVHDGSNTGYKGVVRDGSRYLAQIKKGETLYRLGRFDTAEEAAHAYDDKAVELNGEYAATNFPREGHRWARAHLYWGEEGNADYGALW